MALPHLHDGPNLGGSHGRTVGILSRAIRGQDILSLLSGPPKSGKTTILAATIAGLASEPIQFIKLSNPDGATLEQRDLGSRLIGTPIDGSSLDIVAAVRARLADLANGMQLVIAVDDAQTLSDQAIELLLLLASPVRASRTPPQLILVGEGDFWVIRGGHGRFCPGLESGVDTQSLSDSR
jgi:type II secretory pathway predicted ATPase ExeA